MLKAIGNALEAGLRAVKVNCVVMQTINADELAAFVEFTRFRDIEVRFIELMPFAENNFDRYKFVAYHTMIESIKLVRCWLTSDCKLKLHWESIFPLFRDAQLRRTKLRKFIRSRDLKEE